MHCQTCLSVIAGMFHNWDKKLRDWLTTELAHSFPEQNIRVAIWKVNFQGIFDLLECLNWPIRSKQYFKRLDACRLVVNVYKHGFGDSFEDLKKNHRNFLDNVFGDTMNEEERNDYLDYRNLKVNDTDIEGFSEEVIEF